MVTLIILSIEFVFFLIMSALFEYHWRNDDFGKSTTIMVRVVYYAISLACLGGMAIAL